MASDLVTVRGTEFHGVFVVQVPSTECWIHAYMDGRHVIILFIRVFPGTNLTDFNFECVGPTESTMGRYMWPIRIPRKQLMRLIDGALATTVHKTMIGALLDWRRALVQDGLVSIRHRLAAKAIQRSFREANTNPAYQLCKNRLIRESTEMAF